MNYEEVDIRQSKLVLISLFLGLVGIILSICIDNWALLIGITILPLVIISAIYSIKYPVVLFFLIFTVNYYILGITRYIDINGVSFLMDCLMIVLLILICIHSRLLKNIDWKHIWNPLTIGMFIWMLYTLAQIINPSAQPEAWLLSRNLIFNGFIISLITTLLCTNYKTVKILIFLLSIFTLTAVLKALMQKFHGFDSAELRWLNNGGAITHLINTGPRYFSFFTDAGNLGSNMGGAGILFGIISVQTKNIRTKLYYGIVSIASIYAMFLSGTRGAIIVPLAGLLLYTIICKNVKALITGGSLLIFFYVFFAFTTIGQGNTQIRRMRSAFNPSADASFNVRKENQAKLATYLKNKPFGEGLGLSGVENQKLSLRFTTSIPHDSWYVKLWVETGIIGAVLYLGIIFISIGAGAWILMFKVTDPELKARLSGFICCIFGLILSAYGNAFWGQYPTNIIAFTGLSLVLNGKYINEKILTESIKNKEAI
ncbi:O-antigen ligase family protein [Parabacteroides bouchesdurhonensis]|uniref:O-antigen ligase family protein n=1 Tax=Parabacteroides bouchesdurhonensis TaxID=1936995 RepID=UPI000C838955|nr:O-antigen ligase family protein [Parabacteroides bouchesdurhonensis]